MAREGMEYIDLGTGQLRTGEAAQGLFETAAEAMQGIDNTDSQEVGQYLRNRAPGLSLASTDLHARLSALFAAYPPMAVCLACLICRLVDTKKSRRFGRRNQQDPQLIGAFALLKQQLEAERIDELFDAIRKNLEQRHRASSAIEGFNAALRPFLYIHKGVTQNFLELFRAYYNLRTRRWGRHKGTSAYQSLNGTPVVDWLSLLGFPPSSGATVH